MDGTLHQDEMEYDEAMSALRLFLAPSPPLPRHIADDGEQVLPGLVMVVALHRGDQVDFLPPAAMQAVGGRQAVMTRALANMRQLPPPQVASVQAAEGRTDSVVYALDFAADDPFGASRVCDLEGLLTSAGIEPGNRGLLVAVPSWRTVFLHVPSGKGTAAALDRMCRLALVANLQAEERTRISRNVYFVAPDGRRQQVSSADESGQVTVNTRGLIGETLFGPHGVYSTGA